VDTRTRTSRRSGVTNGRSGRSCSTSAPGQIVGNSKLTSPACLVLVNFLGPEFTAPRMTREYLEAWELDVVLLLLRADPKLTSLAVRGMAGLHSLSGKRPCSSFAEAKEARVILDALKKDGTTRSEEKLCECVRVQ